MSVTTFLRDKEVRDRFRQVVTVPKTPTVPILVPSTLERNHALAGTAFDYLMRYAISRLYLETTFDQGWVAESALQYLSASDTKKAKATIAEAREELGKYAQGASLTPRICELCVLLARLEVVYRTRDFKELISTPDVAVVQELQALEKVIDLEPFKNFKSLYLDPTFGKSSLMIGGADADFVLDDLLVDVKTTKELRTQSIEIYQLLCYVLLCEIGGLGEPPREHSLKRIGIYRSRYGCLTIWAVEDVMDMTQYDAFFEWFKVAIIRN